MINIARWVSGVAKATGFARVEGSEQLSRETHFFENGAVSHTDNDQFFVAGPGASLKHLEQANKTPVFVHQAAKFGFYPRFCGPRLEPIIG